MSLSSEINGELQRRFRDFDRRGAPGRYISLPHGFRAEADVRDEIMLYHTDTPSLQRRIGSVELHPLRWELTLNWQAAAQTLVAMLELEQPEITEDIPF